METRTGRKLFCNCNDTWKPGMTEIVVSFPEPLEEENVPCPDCGFYRWFYLNPNDEPKGENND